MNPSPREVIARGDAEAACSRLLCTFYRHFDRGDYAAMAASFTETGEWHRAGKILVGHEAIVAELQKRPVDQKVLHLLSNIVVDVRDDHAADGTAYLTVYRGAAATPVIGAPDLVLGVQLAFVEVDGAWRIRRQVMKREFEFAAR